MHAGPCLPMLRGISRFSQIWQKPLAFVLYIIHTYMACVHALVLLTCCGVVSCNLSEGLRSGIQAVQCIHTRPNQNKLKGNNTATAWTSALAA